MPLNLRGKGSLETDDVMDEMMDYNERNGEYPKLLLLDEEQARELKKTWDWINTERGDFLYSMKVNY